MNYSTALTALIDQAHAKHVRCHIPIPRDETAATDEQVRIAATVGRELADDAFYRDPRLTFGIFDNCREYGFTYSIGHWTFCVYQHRNSDNICIDGCPTSEIQDHGPYGGEDKWDVLFATKWRDYETAAETLAGIMRFTQERPQCSRADIKDAIKNGQLDLSRDEYVSDMDHLLPNV